MYIQRDVSRRDLLAVVRANFPRANLIATAMRIGRLVNEVEALRDGEGMAHNKKGKLVKSVLIGEYWKNQKRQWRLMRREYPSKPRHRPKRMWPRYLIAKLSEEYIRQTGQLPTRGVAGGDPSSFERFADPLLYRLGVDDTQGLVREYLKERQKASPWSESSMT